MASTTEPVLKDALEAYKKTLTAARRALFILCVVSGICLAVARTPSLVAEKVASAGGTELKSPGIPAGSYAVILGLFAIPVLVQWSYREVTRAVYLRSALVPPDSPPMTRFQDEQLALPLFGSPTAWRASVIARCEAVLLLIVVAFGPLVCDYMLLWDYSNQFSFPDDLKAFSGPWGLWFHSPAAGQVVKPTAYNNVSSAFHPALLPPWQAWLYLALLIWAAILVFDMYRCLGIFRMLWRSARD